MMNMVDGEDVYPPYITHYLNGQVPKKPASYKGHNVRYITRKIHRLRMVDVDLRAFPLDSHELPFDFRMPRTKDKDCILCFDIGFAEEEDGSVTIGRGQDSALDAGLLVDKFASATWKIHNPRTDGPGKQAVVKYKEGTKREMTLTLFASREPYEYYQFYYLTGILGTISPYTYSIAADMPAERGSVTFLLLLTIVTFKFLIQSELPKVTHRTSLALHVIRSTASETTQPAFAI